MSTSPEGSKLGPQGAGEVILPTIVSLLFGFAAHGQSIVKVDGSSTVFPLTEAIAEEFQAVKKGAFRVTVGVSGTGGGFKKFCRGETDVQDASRPISESEMSDCKKAGIKYIELPVGFDAIAVVVHPSATWLTKITIPELKKIWSPDSQGKITKWNQVNPEWPATDLKLYGPGSDSGTFDFFTEAVVGKAHSSRGDYTGSQDHNITVTGVSSDKNALGFMPLSYFEPNKERLRALLIEDPKGRSTGPSRATVENGTYFLSRPVFIYVSEGGFKKTEVREFVEFYLENSMKLVDEVKLVPLPKKAYSLGLEHLKKLKWGTMFGGKSFVGFKIENVMTRETAL